MSGLDYGALLAPYPPHLWAETLQRAEAAEEYLAVQSPTAIDAQRFADELNVGFRTFVRLVAAPLPSRRGLSSSRRRH